MHKTTDYYEHRSIIRRYTQTSGDLAARSGTILLKKLLVMQGDPYVGEHQ